MANGREVRFKIDAYTPETMPMARLADYMAEFAVVLGETPNVHFVCVEPGSTILVQRVDEEAMPKVRERVRSVHAGQGPAEAMTAFKRINHFLRQDDGIGVVTEESGAEIIRFPGREQVEAVTFGAFNQEGTLDGVIIRLGGRAHPVPVHLEEANGRIRICSASRDVAKTLGQYIFGPELRVHGVGRWFRDEDGTWILDRFTIASFEVLDDQPLSAVVAQLRDVPGSEWPDVPDPWSELDKIRYGNDEA